MSEHTRIICDTETLNKSLEDLNALPLLILKILEYKLSIVPVSQLILRKVPKPTILIVQGKEAGVPVVFYPPNTTPLFK